MILLLEIRNVCTSSFGVLIKQVPRSFSGYADGPTLVLLVTLVHKSALGPRSNDYLDCVYLRRNLQ